MDRWNKRKKPLRGRNFDSQHLKTLNNESSNSQEDTGPQVELENLWVLWPWRGGVNFTFVRFFFSPFVKKAFLLWFNFNFNFENPDPAGNVINRLEKEICLRPVTPRNLAKRARNFPAQRGRWSFPLQSIQRLSQARMEGGMLSLWEIGGGEMGLTWQHWTCTFR